MFKICSLLTCIVLFSASTCSKLKKQEIVAPVVPAAPAPAVQVVKEPTYNEWSERSDVLLHFTKTGCMGTCPVYEVIVYNDGKASYKGLKYTPRTGKFTSSVPDSVMTDLKNRVNAVSFFTLADEYPTEGRRVADLPNTIVYFHDGTNGKRVFDNFSSPPALQSLERDLATIFSNWAWKAE
jgi:Domain of unknown function (DUF6438)